MMIFGMPRSSSGVDPWSPALYRSVLCGRDITLDNGSVAIRVERHLAHVSSEFTAQRSRQKQAPTSRHFACSGGLLQGFHYRETGQGALTQCRAFKSEAVQVRSANQPTIHGDLVPCL
jgi:hypothetical protein